jgi:hypothetical protein
MEKIVLFKSDGTTCERYWDSKIENYSEKEIDGPEVFSLFKCPVEIEPGTTFETVLNFVRFNEFLKTFISFYSSCYDIDKHFEDMDEDKFQIDG